MAGYVAGLGANTSGHGSSGALGFITNLVKDTGDAAHGFFPGLIQAAEHPIGTAEGIGKATWQTWSPLFHGNLGQFGHQFYAHPLAPLLDVATVFTGGASLAAKVGLKLGDAGLISSDSALAKLGHMPTKLTLEAPTEAKGLKLSYDKYLPKNPIYNKAYRTAMNIADKHPAIPNWFGSSKVYGRLERQDWANSGLAHSVGLAAGMKAGETFFKAGHDPALMKTLEQQLHQRSYLDLLDNSPHVTVHDMMTKYGGKVPDGFAPVAPPGSIDFAKPLFKGGYATDINQFSEHLNKLGDKFLRQRNPQGWQKSVFKDASGQDVVALAHKRIYASAVTDGARSAHFLYNMYRYPTAIWKYAQVGMSPRTVVDNSVGNWVMYSLRQGGAHGVHGFVEAVRYTRGERKAMQMVKEVGQLPESMGPSYFRHFKGELGNTFGSSVLGSETGSTLSKAYQKSMYPIVHRYADRPVRAAAIAAHLRGDPAVQGLMKAGKSFEDAADTALQSNPELRNRAIAHARTVAGNYTTLSKTEKILRDIVPFYLWDKHILMHTGSMLRDRPAVVAAGTAFGQQGSKHTRSILGDIPSYMMGSIPLPFSMPGENGRKTLLDTTGLNPYSTVPDIAALAQALTTGHTEDKPGDTILGTVNPVIQGLVQQTMGTTSTGAPVQAHGGVIPSALTDVFNSIRPVQLIRQAVGAGKPSQSKAGTPTLYKTDINTILSALAGFPIKEADMSHALELQKQIENGGKKPRKGGKYVGGTGG